MAAHVVIKKFRLANPQKKARTTARKRKSNPTVLTTLGYVNPQPRKEGTMKTTRKKNGSKKTAAGRVRKPNPSLSAMLRKVTSAVKPKNKGRIRKRNPEMLGKGMDLLKQGAAAMVGFVVTRQAPQMLLGAKNTGVLGYGVAVAAAVATSMAVTKAAGAPLGNACLIGGAMQVTSRGLNEFVSPVGKVLALSGVGDSMAAGLGELRDGYFPLPVTTQPGTLEPILPQALQQRVSAAPQATATVAAAQMAGLGGGKMATRYASRY